MKILLSLILCVANYQAAVPKQQSDRAHDGFVGPVKKVFVIWTPVSGRNYPEGSKCRQVTNEYDQTGRLTRHSIYPGECGNDEIREDYSYAKDGARTAKTKRIQGANSPPPPPAISSGATPKGQQGPPKIMFKYDAAGRLSEETVILSDGSLSYKLTHTYDAKGRRVETTGYDNLGQLSDRRVYAYSGDEHVPSSFVYYGPNGKVSERTTYSEYEFNANGDWIRRKDSTDEPYEHRGVVISRRSVSITFREIEYYPNK